MSDEPTFQPEEPWEADVSAALGGLPPMEPPVGFIDRALDHRPLHGGRVVAGLLALSIAGLGLSLVADGGVGTDGSTAATSSSSSSAGVGELQTSVGALDPSMLDDVSDGVLSLARQIGFP